MDYKKLIPKIFQKIKKSPRNFEAYNDLFTICRSMESENHKMAHDTNAELRRYIVKGLKRCHHQDAESFYSLYKKSLLFDAPHIFDAYLLYLEINRKPEERFYQPRRKVLKEVADALQALTDDELDELFISMPPRVGKTSILMFYVTWLIGRNSEASNLYSAYSDTITKAFYSGVLEIITDPVTYLWADVFPEANIAQTNAADETINIDRKKRYPSLTCRSLYGTLNGACDCNGVLISDDLIGGIEEALNKDRLVSAWSKVDNNLIPRAKEKAKILWCGTRWSMIDPAGLRMELLQNDDRFKNRKVRYINLSALDENDESQFDYDYGVGFSTEFYQQRRASFERNNDMASWLAQYMGQPIEREGALFTPNELRYFNGELPYGEPDRIFMAVDPAFGGGDFVASPVCYQYGEDIFVPAVVYDDGDKKITQPLLANTVIRHSVQAMQIEANKSTESYKEGIESLLKKQKYRLNITTKSAPTDKAKDQRIFDKAPDIRERMIFLEDGKRDRAYSLFTQYDGTYMFTLTQAIPADGGFRHTNPIGGWKNSYAQSDVLGNYITTYGARPQRNIVESNVTVSVWDGTTTCTDLGTFTARSLSYHTEDDSTNGGKRNFTERQAYGSNRWRDCVYRQWLNSDAPAVASGDNTTVSNWWKPATVFDRVPGGAKWAGFLNGLDPEFVAVLGEVEVKTALCDCDKVGGATYDITYDKVWLQSMTEIFGSNNNGIAEGSQLAYTPISSTSKNAGLK